MTYTSLMVKLLAPIILAASIFLLLPQQVSSNDTLMIKPAEVVAVTKTPVHVVKKPVVQILIKGDCTKYTDIIEKYDWPIATALNICKKESSGDPTQINWKDVHKDAKGNTICVSSRGLMQVACFWPASLGYTLADLIDPVKNIDMAYQIYVKYGFSPWTTYKPIKIKNEVKIEDDTIVPELKTAVVEPLLDLGIVK